MKYIFLELVALIGEGLRRRPALRNGLALAAVLLTLQCGWTVLSWTLFADGVSRSRRAVYGVVTLDSKPLDNAIISFRPLNEEPFSAGANVLAGKFSVPQHSGLFPGKYSVRINASIHDPSLPAPAAGERDTRPGVELLPKRYNAQSELTAEVGRFSSNYFRFELRTN